MQIDRTVSLSCVVAVVLWAATFVLILAGSVAALGWEGRMGAGVAVSLMVHGLGCSAAAATITIRNGQKHQNKLLEDAFKLGQDVASVRRVR